MLKVAFGYLFWLPKVPISLKVGSLILSSQVHENESFNSKLNKKYFLTNKEVKTDTWCKKPPPNTIKEYFIPILLGLKVTY